MAYLITDIGFSHTFLIDINSFKIFSGNGSVYLNIYSRPFAIGPLLRFLIDQVVVCKSHYLRGTILEFLPSQMIYEMMNEAGSFPGVATPGGNADLSLYGVNLFFS